MTPQLQHFLQIGAPPSQTRLESAILGSTYEHELRHFHQFLLSPYSSKLFRGRVMSLRNGMNYLSHLKSQPGRYIPAPLERWSLLPPQERQRQLRNWCTYAEQSITAADVVEVPHFDYTWIAERSRAKRYGNPPEGSDEYVRLLLELTVGAYLGYRESTQGVVPAARGLSISPQTVFELDAIAVQLEAINRSHGRDAADEIVMRFSREGTAYGRLLGTVAALAAANGHTTPDSLSRMALWSMFGNPMIEAKGACPALRLVTLLKALSDEPRLLGTGCGTRAVWDSWDERLSRRSWREQLLAWRDSARHSAQQCVDSVGMLKSAKTAMATLAEYHAVIVGLIIEDPDSIASPRRYLSDISSLPAPLISHSLIGLGIECGAVRDLGGTIVHVERNSRNLVNRFIVDDAQHGTLDADTAMDLESWFHRCDAVFADGLVPLQYEHWARQEIEMLTGKRVMTAI